MQLYAFERKFLWNLILHDVLSGIRGCHSLDQSWACYAWGIHIPIARACALAIVAPRYIRYTYQNFYHDYDFVSCYYYAGLGIIHLTNLSHLEYLVQRVEEEPLIKASTQCKDFLIEAMKFHLLKADQKALYKTPRTKQRTPIGLPKVALIG